jgi:hypothetical protein
MGVVKSINYDSFPNQGSFLNRIVEVYFHYNTSKKVLGKVIRDDSEEPGETLIRLIDGRVIKPTECQYSIMDLSKNLDKYLEYHLEENPFRFIFCDWTLDPMTEIYQNNVDELQQSEFNSLIVTLGEAGSLYVKNNHFRAAIKPNVN